MHGDTISRFRISGAALAIAGLWLAVPVGAQSVLLRLHPRVGDTLYTRLEQVTEVSGTIRGVTSPALKPVTTSVALHSRTIVQSSLSDGTVVLTIVDSAAITTSDAHAASQASDAQRSLVGQRLLLHLASDGTVEKVEDARGGMASRAVAASMSAMPAVFPRRAVTIGEQWTRVMPLPAGGPLGARGSGHVRAVFRLDSIERAGNAAYVSMRGEIVPDSSVQGVHLSGTVTGAMQVDRARGWMTDSRFIVLVQSLVTPPPATGIAPMRIVTRVTQRLSTMDKR